MPTKAARFASGVWIDVLSDAKTKISMNGKGAWRDNCMIERLGRSQKYEDVYLHAFETGSEMRAGVREWLIHNSSERPHSTLEWADWRNNRCLLHPRKNL